MRTGNVFVAQVYWGAVHNTWPSSSKASVAKCVVCNFTCSELYITNQLASRSCYVPYLLRQHC